MNNENGEPKVIEYNVRWENPERDGGCFCTISKRFFYIYLFAIGTGALGRNINLENINSIKQKYRSHGKRGYPGNLYEKGI